MELDFNVEISNDVSEYEALYNKLFKKTLNMLNVSENAIMSVTFVSKEQIHQINKTYRNIDRPTDVLSFPMFEPEEISQMIKENYEIEDALGDMVISIPQVEIQAKEYGHSFLRELSYMVVHSFYHLMGYDHIEEADKRIMRAKEDEILNKLNITREG